MQSFVRSGFVAEPAGWDMGFHVHETFGVSVVLAGRGIFECEGKTYSLETGHVVLVPANLPHTYRGTTDMRFGVLEAGHMQQETVSLFQRLLPAPASSGLLVLPPIALEQYEGLFRQWLRMISQPLTEAVRLLTAWVDLFLLFLLQHRNSGSLTITVAASADHIRTNLRSEISVTELAKQCGLSESAFRALFKEAFGASPKQYQQACRSSEAQWLLRSTSRPIQWIAEQVGFSGVHAFSAWFQKNEGISPSEWRKAQQSRP